ncbi:hypothetical protein D3C71_1238510 [compost metagenome]
MVLPQPLSPWMAMRSPGRSCNCSPSSNALSCPGQRKATCSTLSVAGSPGSGTGSNGSATPAGWSTICSSRTAATRPDSHDCQARPMAAHSSSRATVRNTRPAARAASITPRSKPRSATHSIATSPAAAHRPCSALPPIRRQRRRRSRDLSCLAATSTRWFQCSRACRAVRSAAPSSPSKACARSCARCSARSRSWPPAPRTVSHGTPTPINSASTPSTPAAGR